METVIATKIKSETQGIQLGYWDDKKEEWVELSIGDDLKEAAQHLDCSEALLTALMETLGIVSERVNEDLCSIWKRLDEMERRR